MGQRAELVARVVGPGEVEYKPFWSALSSIFNLRYLMVEATFLNRHTDHSGVAGHTEPELLARGLKQLSRPLQLLITHLEAGNEDAVMTGIKETLREFMPQRLKRVQIFTI